jgi:hypothetical protein
MFKLNKRKMDDSDSDGEDVRKGYLKARKDKDPHLPPPDFDNPDTMKFNSEFARQLLE